ncbi:MAG TPA: PVC-type heme-binding CxxCH protein [Planctomycetota bacterium]|nr:PVC-type heme-binding CxxCH protein [Planctomycetota bacterium]
MRLVVLLGLVAVLVGEEPWDALVRGTEALTAAEQATRFHLPDGFAIELVACEPQVRKPMNLAFDARGRLWLTDSVEYPFPAADGAGRDTVKVLEDVDGDGRFEKVTTFADGLNIPIGLHPYGSGVIVFSIPKVWFIDDRDGDGVGDQRTELYGDVGRSDTHGMLASFRRGFDGWIRATHGFANTSRLVGADGQAVELVSGWTLRFRPDGGRVESWAQGMINPFGSCFDARGDWYVSDCHSKPISQILRGGCYTSWHVANDGLGPAPEVMDHVHDSTGLCGVATCQTDRWPEAYRGDFFVCNVLTSRINRDAPEIHGSTTLMRERPDLVTCDDPWFRPVDLRFAPDGALYIADFYNRIIGHYEVDLRHPGRDRERGRIWRLAPKGIARRAPDLSRADEAGLIAAMGDGTLPLRMAALDELCDRSGPDAAAALRGALAAPVNEDQHACLVWAAQRLGLLDDATLTAAMAAGPTVRVHALGALAERGDWDDDDRALAIAGLRDDDAFVRRAAGDALSRHPAPASVRAVIATLAAVPADDIQLRYKLRQALRDHLRHDACVAALDEPRLDEAERALVVDAALGAESPGAARLLLAEVRGGEGDDERIAASVRHVARNLPGSSLVDLLDAVDARFADRPGPRLALAGDVRASLIRREGSAPEVVEAWCGRTASAVIEGFRLDGTAWTAVAGDLTAWGVDGRYVPGRLCISSLVAGEARVGTVRSPVFACPARLSFRIAGHDGVPERAARGANRVRLIAGDGVELASAPAPRSDQAVAVDWDLAAHAGRAVMVEIIDGDDGGGHGYAWIAAGAWDPAVVPEQVPAVEDLRAAARLAGACRGIAAAALLRRVARYRGLDDDTRAAAGVAAIACDPARAGDLVAVTGAADDSPEVRARIALALTGAGVGAADAVVIDLLSASPASRQTAFAADLVATRRGAGLLLAAVADGRATGRLLQDRGIVERIGAHDPAFVARAGELTAALPQPSAEREELIRARIAGYVPGSAAAGEQVFRATCIACHRLGGDGALIGPQLDGIGKRRAARLIEDILDPGRNVDNAYRMSVLTLVDGRVVSGFVRREEGETLIIADAAGGETAIATADVRERVVTPGSLMPEIFGQVLSEQQLRDLVAFLGD